MATKSYPIHAMTRAYDAPHCAALLVLVCLIAAIVTPGFIHAAENEANAESDPWGPLPSLEGTWQGLIDGRFGQGTGIRRYEHIFEGLYLLSKHASLRMPQKESPQGDYHRELTVFSVDRERGTVALREFHLEGYVITYSCEVAPQRVVCTSDNIESGKGMRARLTLNISSPHQFEEIFELASPGKALELYFRNRWTRLPDLEDAMH